MALHKFTLVLGGAASGKSTYAETLVKKAGTRPTYIATAQVFDDEMAQKVVRHREMRGQGWHTIEEPLALADAIRTAPDDQPLLVDCATLWLTNLILGEHDLTAHSTAFFAAVQAKSVPIVVVSNEVGQGIVPDNALSRQFRNAQGKLNQDIAIQADGVVAVMAGLPLALKGQLS